MKVKIIVKLWDLSEYSEKPKSKKASLPKTSLLGQLVLRY